MPFCRLDFAGLKARFDAAGHKEAPSTAVGFPTSSPFHAVPLSQDLLEELGGMKAAQSQMGEELRMIKGMLGLVSHPHPLHPALPHSTSPRCCTPAHSPPGWAVGEDTQPESLWGGPIKSLLCAAFSGGRPGLHGTAVGPP